MKNRNFEMAAVSTGAVTLPLAAVVWVMAVPGMMSGVTFSAVAMVAAGAAFVAFNTWRNGRATENISHVLRRAEVPVQGATADRSRT